MTEHLIDQATDVYCHKLARIDQLGPNRRLIFTVPSVEGGQYEQIVVKLIVPAEVMATLAYMAAGTDPTRTSLELLAVEPRTAN
ncbi:hypothetical protein IVB22_33115 [Bradyrhizobium sp. 190]|uniref:hypothetical protein n=1 Tax=Bradyrhizobium sp. 190 TaxID=2782658 RepID=UPI001FFAA3AB|nr:hypothetical protein [Bradyrhizobium sp. 190]MCK1517261.1 hypothetical protein [Bradyrhizobium sp. 190]